VTRSEVTGYAFIKYSHEHGFAASPGNVYPYLRELEEDGLIAHQVAGRRKIYSLTRAGHRYMKEHGLIRVPEFLRNMFLRNVSLALTIDWADSDAVAPLISNLEQMIAFLKEYLPAKTDDSDSLP